jgi:hypothetical protein
VDSTGILETFCLGQKETCCSLVTECDGLAAMSLQLALCLL